MSKAARWALAVVLGLLAAWNIGGLERDPNLPFYTYDNLPAVLAVHYVAAGLDVLGIVFILVYSLGRLGSRPFRCGLGLVLLLAAASPLAEHALAEASYAGEVRDKMSAFSFANVGAPGAVLVVLLGIAVILSSGTQDRPLRIG